MAFDCLRLPSTAFDCRPHQGSVAKTLASEVKTVDGEHKLKLLSDGSPFSLALHPWNHAPADLAAHRFDALKARHVRAMKTAHATLVDALTGRRLDVIKQCVPTVLAPVLQPAQTAASLGPIGSVSDVASLASWLQATQAALCSKAEAPKGRACVLLTAEAAQGKTCLMSQLITSLIKDERSPLVPILVRVQLLQAHLLNERRRTTKSMSADTNPFASAWNFVDAHLQVERMTSGVLLCVPITPQLHPPTHHTASSSPYPSHRLSTPLPPFPHLWQMEHGRNSDLYAMLRQAMSSRRAILLIDGIDEGGQVRDVIERHVTEVLAPQGHVIVVTSRPAGLDASRFQEHFWHLRLCPLTDRQQLDVIEKRLGAGAAVEALPRYLLEKVIASPMISLMASDDLSHDLSHQAPLDVSDDL